MLPAAPGHARPVTEPAPPLDPEALLARIGSLERDSRRAFEDAQREADALFAQYQLSQLLASGGSLATLASAVLVELVRLADARVGAIWLGDAVGHGLALVAALGDDPAAPDPSIPARHETLDRGRAWCAAQAGCTPVVLAEEPPATLLALWEAPDRALDADGVRVAQLARHELGVAFAGARLREALERERHELSAIVDGATDVIVQVDENLRVVRLNAAGERLLGRPTLAAVGERCVDVLGCVGAGGHAEADCPLAEVLAGGGPIGYRETAAHGADGAVVRLAGSYVRASADPGTAVRATAILRDMTAAQALEHLRESFVATVSHELRTPLALIRGYADTLLHLELDPAAKREYVTRILGVADRLTALVNDIVDIAHLDADPLVLESGPTSFAALVARLRGDLAASGGDARLEVDVPADLPPLEVDSGRVGQVLENIVGNALKYSPAESVVRLGARVAGARLVVSVTDEGIGLPEGERSLVLEPFHRAANTRESSVPGSGLGLYIARRLVEAHGGRLSLEPGPGGTGTRVTFDLPLLERARAASRSPRR